MPLTDDELCFLHPRHDKIVADQARLFLEAAGQATSPPGAGEHRVRLRGSGTA
ncbi:hypothetical protein [Kribbella pittospori]|uniref:hypothetical protein n=1 Tax=Kribbella pittospori TaxID=722689 RepID=UPI0013F47378|nr:hypothetical protein [Kribbella pittospori]